MQDNSIIISAIICTHNRPEYLRKSLKSLINQNFPKESYEIIVVDNASAPDTENLIEEFPRNQNLRYIYEPILGLSQARNTGYKAAKGRYVAYLDDDAIAFNSWLNNIINAFEKSKIKPKCVGGRIEPIWELPKPRWLYKELEVFLSVLDYSDKAEILDKQQNLFGTNIAFVRKILEDLGGFSVSLGRVGERLISGDEILLQDKIRNLGYKVVYDPKISVEHHIPESRLNKQWFLKRMYYEGVSNALLEIYRYNPSKPKRIWLAAKKILSSVIPLKEMLQRFVLTKSLGWFYYKCLLTIRMGYAACILYSKN